jgi:hypothetical protein
MTFPRGITEKTDTGMRRTHPNLFSSPHNNAVNPKRKVIVTDTKNVNPTPPVRQPPDENQ